MVQALSQTLTLEEFLKRPDTKPANEYNNGHVIQKPMPQGEHSILQGELCEAINLSAKSQKIARAFPELRCVFGGNVIVPDVSVFRWERIPRMESGRVANRFEIHPDWAIEILSPDQSSTKLLGKLLDCIQHGTELGWLLDPSEESILITLPGQRVQISTGNSVLPMLSGIDLSLTAEEIFERLLI
jgi:Uma2 family endonuclease